MLNSSNIMRRLVQIDPLFSPTRSVFALLGALDFIQRQGGDRNVHFSEELLQKFAQARAITSADIIENPSRVLETIREMLVAIRAEIPKTDELMQVRIPESVDSMRFVTSVESLANTLLSIIAGLNLLPAA